MEKETKIHEMGEERLRELLENFANVVAGKFDLDTAISFMRAAGFTDQEIAELRYEDNLED